MRDKLRGVHSNVQKKPDRCRSGWKVSCPKWKRCMALPGPLLTAAAYKRLPPGFAYCTVRVTSSRVKSVLPEDEVSLPVNLMVTVWPMYEDRLAVSTA